MGLVRCYALLAFVNKSVLQMFAFDSVFLFVDYVDSLAVYIISLEAKHDIWLVIQLAPSTDEPIIRAKLES